VRLALAAVAVLSLFVVACGGQPLAHTGPACASAEGEPIREDLVIEVLRGNGFELEHASAGCSTTLSASLSNIPVDDEEWRRSLDWPGHLSCAVHTDPSTVGKLADPALMSLLGGDRILLERLLENVKCTLFANHDGAVERLDRALRELERATP
jgi:hypothetical protein